MFRTASLAAVAVSYFVVPSVRAATVLGGLTYSGSTSSGYLDTNFSEFLGDGANAGTAVGSASKYSNGDFVGVRAVRWVAGGTAAIELGNLGTDLTGGTYTVANAVNASGTTVGFAEKYKAGNYIGGFAVRWNAGSTFAFELGNLGTDSGGSTHSVATAINAAGITVGYAAKYIDETAYGDRAVRWSAAGVPTELGTLGIDTDGNTNCSAVAVNAAGTTVGSAWKFVDDTYAGTRAVRWNAGRYNAIELGNLGTDSSGTTYSEATAVNAAGTTVGFAQKYDGDTDVGPRAVRWDAGGTAVTQLGDLGTDSDGNTSSNVVAINVAGTAVGFAQKYVAGTYVGNRAVRWDAGRTAVIELGNLGTDRSGTTTTVVNAINAFGTAVGSADKYVGGAYVGQRAVGWGLDGVAFDLNAVLAPSAAALWTLTAAQDISDTDWVTGLGNFDPDGTGPLASYERAFMIRLGMAGDADGNDRVDFNDLMILQAHFNQPGTFEQGDFNYDGVVNFSDFMLLQINFGQTRDGVAVAVSAEQLATLTAFGEAVAVPEPATLAVMMSAVILAGARPRRRSPA